MIDDGGHNAMMLLSIVIGAIAGSVPTLMIERMRHRSALGTRWDNAIQGTCAEFAACARTILDLAEHHAALRTADQPASLEQIRRERGQLQTLMTEVRILADEPVQLAARRFVRHAWALQVTAATGIDPRAADYPHDPPRERALAALFDFYRAVRRQLRVPDAADLAPLNPPYEVVPR
ncbi:hypothetical protein GCM10010112_75240 [Actinoplanes lobatus]|uniref:Uncharacterized protein n=1 Tax=Actinoplanes lobatus TaxID=113568 RepID=A0A7W7HH79_9ACTN|nr:hypothetical protein [Actinoplanes lobatus]MBB4750475.1 hypothetical protein [Actinoplanes lobatus]GGN90125.1 hypothetical protein GCM10010112_75240 [Actinoplanes lobatus]GIE43848.1 hypothetical protein Alo02nite_67460 [Actinoplanes lobatus]